MDCNQNVSPLASFTSRSSGSLWSESLREREARVRQALHAVNLGTDSTDSGRSLRNSFDDRASSPHSYESAESPLTDSSDSGRSLRSSSESPLIVGEGVSASTSLETGTEISVSSSDNSKGKEKVLDRS